MRTLFSTHETCQAFETNNYFLGMAQSLMNLNSQFSFGQSYRQSPARGHDC